MSARARRGAIATLVASVLIWPLAHLVLVARFETDPWELFGWAMYAQPAPRLSVRIDVGRGAQLQPLRAMGPLREQVRAWARRRSTLGRLASPDPLVRAVLASDPSIETIVLTLRRLELDRETARLAARDERLRFERPIAPSPEPDPIEDR